MSTLTLELEDETSSLLQTEARKVNLSPVEFARLTIPDTPPQSGDELPG
jgi:hypothetical protein